MQGRQWGDFLNRRAKCGTHPSDPPRLLDDNRELYVPELQETIRPHPHFMLFATQNPPGLYAGRKALSRAFRSRFLEMQVDDIPSPELITILEHRWGGEGFGGEGAA